MNSEFLTIDPSSSPALLLEGVEKSFAGRAVLRRIDLRVEQGECAVILGRSGSGKSVMLRLLLGFLTPDDGRARVLGELPPFSPYRRQAPGAPNVAALFQNDALFEDKTIAENIEAAIQARGKTPSSDRSVGSDGSDGSFMVMGAPVDQNAVRDRTGELLTKVGLDAGAVADLAPSHLSGGMRKRAALARALAAEPRVLLVDEPTSGLDIQSGALIAALLKETLREQAELTALVITHDLNCALTLADRLFFLSDGRLEEIPLAGADADSLKRDLGKRMGARESGAPAPAAEAPASAEERLRLFFRGLGRGLFAAREALAPPNAAEWLRRFQEMTVGSLPLIYMVFFILGMVIYIQSRAALGPLGMASKLPEIIVEAGLKMVPFLAGLILAGRVGSAICAETGVLRQTEQLDAMRVFLRPPERRLLAPWLWSALAAFPLLTLFGEACALFGSLILLATVASGDLTLRAFWVGTKAELDAGLLGIGLFKSALFGAAIVLTAYFFGAREQQGAGAVGRSITAALAGCYLLIVILEFLITLATTGY